jgi:hypothetical protein
MVIMTIVPAVFKLNVGTVSLFVILNAVKNLVLYAGTPLFL